MSLRELPPEQTVDRDRWRHVRYLPLILLLIAGLVAGAVGFITDRRLRAEEARPASIEPTVGPDDTTDPTAEACRPAVEPPAQEPWLEGDAVAAEAVWTAHVEETSSPIVRGEDGWIDWGDVQGMNFSQAIGRRTLTVGEVERWTTYFATLQSALAEQGIPFYVVITPSKFGVYPDELPTWAQEIRGSGPVDQLLAAGGDLPLIDLRADLRAAAEDDAVFSRINSHWNNYGAYVGWQRVAACLGEAAPELGDLSGPAIDGVGVDATSNEWADYGVAAGEADGSYPVYSEPLGEVSVTNADGITEVFPGDHAVGLDDLPVATTTVGAGSTASALVFRDSFGSALSIPLQQAFARTWQVRHNIDFGPGNQPDILALAAERSPDVVIFQVAARHLNFPPAG